MSVNSYSSSAPPIMEGWLIKALRLVYSKNPADREKLRKLYKDACENESQVSRITVAEALREPRDANRSDTSEVEPSSSTASRVRIGTTGASQAPIPVAAISTFAASVVGSTMSISSSGASQTVHSPTVPVQSPTPSSTAAKTAKRTRVAFFNIFDAAGSGASRPATSALSASKSTTLVTNPDALVIDLTESSNLVDLPLPRPPLDSIASGDASSNTITSNSSPRTPIGLSIPHSVTLPPLSMGPVESGDNASEKTADVASLVADLACGVCGKLTQPPRLEPDGKSMNPNMLVECVQCKALYHQLCHDPPLLLSSTARNPQEWRCGNCCDSSMCSSPGPQPTSSSSLPMDVGTECSSIGSPITIGARKRKGGLPSAIFGPSSLKS
ncbi:unnamed protein product [Dicrocoelium dendriticum]|nr:unnamed protein product [Dicrocoelium dendriticum]